jgi:hypothetical protein
MILGHADILAALDLLVLMNEREAKKGGRGCLAERLAAYYRGAAAAVRGDEAEMQRDAAERAS